MSQKTFPAVNVDLQQLATELKAWFIANGFEVQSADNQGIHLLQARKTSGLRTLLGTNQAFNVKIEGSSGDYTVDIGTGKWMENLTGAGLTGLFTGGITWLTAAGGAAWVKKLEGDLWNWFDMRNVQNRAAPTAAPAPPAAAPAATAPSIPDQLKKLAELRDMGILSNDEFDAKKKELLSRM
jgi:Short C-terminal domain